MNLLVYVCKSKDGGLLGTFTRPGLAKQSWIFSYHNVNGRPEFEYSSNLITVKHLGKTVGYIQTVPVYDHVEHI